MNCEDGGRQNGFGRKAGVPNRVPRVVKEGLLLAAEHVGRKNHPERPFDGLVAFLEDIALQRPAVFVSLQKRRKETGKLVAYLEHVAETQPVAFVGLLGKILPSQVDNNGEHPTYAVAIRFD